MFGTHWNIKQERSKVLLFKKKKEKRHCTIHHIHRQILKVPRTSRRMLGGIIKVGSRHEVYSQVVSRCNSNESYFVIQLHSPANLDFFFSANKKAPGVCEGILGAMHESKVLLFKKKSHHRTIHHTHRQILKVLRTSRHMLG